MVSPVSHAVVAIDQESCLIVHAFDYFLYNRFHVFKLFLNIPFIIPSRMSSMIDSNKMPKQQGEISILHLCLQLDSCVAVVCIQIGHTERIIGVRPVKVRTEETVPGEITRENYRFILNFSCCPI